MYYWDIFPPKELQEMVDQGYVKVQKHPKFPYRIACYTKKAMFDRKWNDVTQNCRGLIWNEFGEILARPFKKFFNYGEPSAPVFDPMDLVEVTDKMDGSLGILYNTPEGLAVATKGSFASDQALWATQWLRNDLSGTEWYPADGVTYLFEIIYPENRIVVDYGDREGLYLLATIDIETGRDRELDIYNDPFPYQDYFGRGQFAQVIGLPHLKDRPNREGIVLRRLSDDERLKIKQQDYIELHRVMTGLNERQLWKWLSQGQYSKDILPNIPEEMHHWARAVMSDLTTEYLTLLGQVEIAYKESKYMDRKDFALFNAGKPNWIKGALFAKYDGNLDRVNEIVWNQVKP